MRSIVVTATTLLVVLLAPAAGADGGGRAEDVAVGSGRVWTTLDNRVVAVDPATGRIEAPAIHTGGYGAGLAVDGRTLWRLQPHSLVAASVSTRRVRFRTRLRAAHSPQAVAVGGGSVWLASIGPWHAGKGGVLVPDGPGIVLRIDPVSGAVRARVRIGRGPQAIAVGDGSVWVLNGRGLGADDTLDRIDLQTNHVVASMPVPHWSTSVAVGRRCVWVVSEPQSAGGVVTRIDARTNRPVTRRIPRSWIPAAVVLAAGSVWIADPGVAQLIRVDPRTLRVTGRVGLPLG